MVGMCFAEAASSTEMLPAEMQSKANVDRGSIKERGAIATTLFERQ